VLPAAQGPTKFKVRYKTRNDKLHNKHTKSLAHIPDRR
jgi:hypothetical protein